MHFKYSEHAKLKLREREIQEHEVEEILRKPREILLDIETGNLIMVGDRKSKQNHKLIVVYSREKNKVVTIIDTSKTEIIKKRKEIGRWVKIK